MESDIKVSGKTKVLAVIGSPIEHSISPQLHNLISRHLGLDIIYVPFKVDVADIEYAVKGLKALNVIGFNVTVPYKRDVMKIVDDCSQEAFLIGAVNTVKNVNGKLYGYNTDTEGFFRSFREESGTDFKDKKVVVLGAGGATRAIAVKIAMEGAEKIFLINRTISKAYEIEKLVSDNFPCVIESFGLGDKKAGDAFMQSDIVINTTSIGMYPDIESSPGAWLPGFIGRQIVYDIVYNPVKTKFLTDAEKKGCKTVNGLGMLFYQGVSAYEIWMGIKLADDLMAEVHREFLKILDKRK